MAPTLTAPGVYIEERTGAPRCIEGVSTSTALFIGWASRGSIDEAVRVASVADCQRGFGALDSRSDLGPAVAHFFANGGSDAWIVRLAADDATVATSHGDALSVTATSPGAWGNRLRIGLVKRRGRSSRFRLDVRERGARGAVVESFADLSLASDDPRHAPTVVNAASTRVRIDAAAATATDTAMRSHTIALAGGSDGSVLVAGTDAFRSALIECFEAGQRVDAIESFNLLCVPGEASSATQALLQTQCAARRAFYIADADANATADGLAQGPDPSLLGPAADHAALYAPRVLAADPAQNGNVRAFPPSGFVAGIYARFDAAYGVWKAPAGPEARLIGSAGLSLAIDQTQNDRISHAGIDCLRHFPATGDVVWGARTTAGSDAQNSQWKYVPVRRLALFVEASIDAGLQWTVFEPNSEALWSQVCTAVGDFLHGLWALGALPGSTPRDAFFVHCDRTTMTQEDIDNGRLGVVIGIAPTRPAEFVIIRIGAFAQCRLCQPTFRRTR